MSYVFRQGDLPKLDLQVDRGTDFAAWKAQWEAYFSLSGLDSQPDAKQVQALTLCFSRETVTIVDNLGLTADQRGKAKDVIAAVERYVQGQINETVERRNFRRRVQQEGEMFDDFLVSLRELAKTCNFCSDTCMQKSIRDQIIEGLLDGETVEDLLKERDLSLDSSISKCRAHEAAKRQRAEILGDPQDTAVRTLRKPRPDSKSAVPTKQECPGCGSVFHPGGRKQCPAYHLVCHTCNKVGHLARVCKARRPTGLTLTHSTDSGPATKAVYVVTPQTGSCPTVNASRTQDTRDIEPAPTIKVHISNPNGTANVKALPDSGADISVAGIEVIELLGDHRDNLLPSRVTPRTVSGHKMCPMGRLPVTITLEGATQTDDLYIHPDIKGVLLSWKTSRNLHILPAQYPIPLDIAARSITTDTPSEQPRPVMSDELIKEFQSVFDGQVKAMEGEQFHIAIADDAKPFCVKTPRAIPFAYRDKLK